MPRRAVGGNDVLVAIDYCGVSRSDIHQARNEWAPGLFPMVPGHEIVGRVMATGADVRGLNEGDSVGVGCMTASCMRCEPCLDHMEQFCLHGMTPTYNGFEQDRETPAYGGYAESIVVDRHFVLNVPGHLAPAAAAPLLGAGITAWSPLRHWKVGPGKRVGIAGLGGIGHLAVKFATAFGAETIAITTSAVKARDAQRLGAGRAILSTRQEEMKWNAASFDFILNTIPLFHDINPYLDLLKPDGTMILASAQDRPLGPGVFSVGVQALTDKKPAITGAMVGGLMETQAMLDYCGRHNIVADVEIVPIQAINAAFDRVVKGDVRYRFAIDLRSLAGRSA